MEQMDCRHEGFHTVTSHYDHAARTLVFVRLCEECGAQLGEELRQSYEPRQQPMPSPAPDTFASP
jgi:hypothetical protein